ncbi:hypothetical protein O7606_18710 [Micromonospora sp. WMMD882]|uniref:hypothetical protein n=1 Tax=Micromonospora sp. WMMD882 TaxID=3015151 RepID=UPI00248D35E3|nr:hypothetical protein [Micromonospora sp. WMMD882]WBB78256.1 hypothetical protein O7606_18710 [Micromonospora sp. WMMD882]
MTHDHLDRTIRDADPYRPGTISHLDGAAQNLLEEIMSVPTLEPVAGPPAERRRPRRRFLPGRLAVAGVAAAVLAGLLGVSLLVEPPGEPGAPPIATETTDPATGPARYSAMVLKAAEENPRLLIDEPGWQVTTVYGFAEQEGTIAFGKGGRTLEMNWYPAARYDLYRADRLHVSKPEQVSVNGWPGDLFRYSASDFAVMLRPRDGSFVELRTSGAWSRTDFDKVLASVVRVDARSWLAALPPHVVTPETVDERAAEILADVPLPPGFDPGKLTMPGANDTYQFGVEVIGRVGCGWIAEWLRAKEAGDDAAARRAVDALNGSRKWKVLRQMDVEGDWPEVFWETTDRVAAGRAPDRYQEALGCD